MLCLCCLKQKYNTNVTFSLCVKLECTLILYNVFNNYKKILYTFFTWFGRLHLQHILSGNKTFSTHVF